MELSDSNRTGREGVDSASPKHGGRGAGPVGQFVDFQGERCYVIRDIDLLPPFLMSIVSSGDHWLFCASNGGLTAGRGSPETALFPYVSVDKVYDSAHHTGSRTIIKVSREGRCDAWQPWLGERGESTRIRRSLYKNLLGNRVWFEEFNDDLGLVFRYGWTFSDTFGFVRQCELVNLSNQVRTIDLVDGLQNILPAGAPRQLQGRASNLIDAYKWSELDEATGLGVFTLYSGISDKPEPVESLMATAVFGIGLEDRRILLSTEQLSEFLDTGRVEQERLKTGVRGAYLMNARLRLASGQAQRWQTVANLDLNQVEATALRGRLTESDQLLSDLQASIEAGGERLARMIAGFDGFQQIAEEQVIAHHYANTLYNVLRGGAFVDQYNIEMTDFRATVKHFNRGAYARNERLMMSLSDRQRSDDLLAIVSKQSDDPWLERLCREYLPLTFGRRHGDPSRPWNEFDIRLRDESGRTLYYYEGNWRDMFQNWEAAAWSYPLFVLGMIAKFVNGSTVDGHNPYRITKDGIDWEVEDPDDPWSFIGYWGDHQVIYLLKLLEFCNGAFPDELRELLFRNAFAYANVPYRIRPFEGLLANPKTTIDYDHRLAEEIDRQVEAVGMDGQLVLDQEGQVYLVPLIEKLLVTLLSKLANLVPGGGIWMNTQRPEWNDANNALVGYGLSVVTLGYLRRYLCFLHELLQNVERSVEISAEVADWFEETYQCLTGQHAEQCDGTSESRRRYLHLARLGLAASRYRQRVYRQNGFRGRTTLDTATIRSLLDLAQRLADASINANHREDGLYHAYNLLNRTRSDSIEIDNLYPMLEGQVAALSCGSLSAAQAVRVLEALYESELYRPDQDSFMLYPDRRLPGFFEKNLVSADLVPADSALRTSLVDDTGILVQDVDGNLRFDESLVNERALAQRLEAIECQHTFVDTQFRRQVFDLYEQVFRHKAYTGRSGGMFGFEGLGCIYWHMVGKLLLAVQESYFKAIEDECDEGSAARIAEYYYRIRQGLGFNKTPVEYGAFPYDPYSHTPRHAGAQQPGMTGQVKEEIVARFGELGVRIRGGRVHLRPRLLRRREFSDRSTTFDYLDLVGCRQNMKLPEASLAFTFCQVPVVYLLEDVPAPYVEVTNERGDTTRVQSLELPESFCTEIFHRTGRVAKVSVHFPESVLLGP